MKYKPIVALFLSLGCVVFEVGKTQGAVADPRDIQVLVAAQFQPLVWQGASALEAKKYDLAISRFTAALQMNPDKNTASVLYNLRAKAYIYQRRWDQAFHDANAAIRLNPGFYDPYVARAIVYRSRGNLEKAIGEYNTAIQLNPNAIRAYNNRGIAESKRGRQERAVADFDRALRVDPNFADAYMNRAIAYEEMGKLDRAIADLDQAIRLDPKVDYGRYNRGRLHGAMGNFDKAILDLTEAIRQGGDGDDIADTHRIRANAYKEKGNYSAASSDYAKARQMSPRNDAALNALAWFRATCPDASFRNGRQAVEDATKACELTKWEDGDNIDTLAAAYAEVGDFGNAVKYQSQAISKAVLSAEARKDMEQRLRTFKQGRPWREKSKL